MKEALKLFSICMVLLLSGVSLMAQDLGGIMTTEAGAKDETVKPVDDIVEKRITYEKKILPYESLREADIMWEKRVWRVIDAREKINLPFAYPKRMFSQILIEAAINGDITVYEEEDFQTPLTPDEVASLVVSYDSVYVMDPETFEESLQVTPSEIDLEKDVKRFRLKEVWFFDEESSELKVRILGISPIRDVYDEQTGIFQYKRSLFWVYYPELRPILAKERYFSVGNDAANITWEDIMEQRRFSSYIYKASNVQDERIEAFYTGVDRLLEAEKIKMEIFNFEHDLWSY